MFPGQKISTILKQHRWSRINEASCTKRNILAGENNDFVKTRKKRRREKLERDCSFATLALQSLHGVKNSGI